MPGWKAGSVAAYCEKMEKMREREMAEEATGASSDSSRKDEWCKMGATACATPTFVF